MSGTDQPAADGHATERRRRRAVPARRATRRAPRTRRRPTASAWDTTTVANGSHTLAARARDAAGNTATSRAVTVTVNNAAAATRRWSASGVPLIPLPAVAIHSALTPTGKILLFQGDFTKGGQQYVFDPPTGDGDARARRRRRPVLRRPGGARRRAHAGGRRHRRRSGGLGVNDNTAFDWQIETLERAGADALPALVRDGDDAGRRQGARHLRLRPNSSRHRHRSRSSTRPVTNIWKSLTAASRSIPFYPFVYQLPDGRIAHLGASEVPTPTESLDLDTNQWTHVDSRAIDGGSIANYAPGQVHQGRHGVRRRLHGQSASTAYTLDMNQPARPGSRPSMAFPRSFLNLTNLPDGTVLATGGGTDKSGTIDANGVLPAETGTRRREPGRPTPR